jgi:hypothetical protein
MPLLALLSAVQPSDEQLVDARRLLTPEERAKMIARIHSLVYWVGMLIPEHEILGDSEIDLRQVVYNITTKEHLSEDDIAQVNSLIQALKGKERELERHLKKDELTVQAAKELLEEICGLLRAVEELRTVETPAKAEFRKQEVLGRMEDAKRWRRFLEAVRYNP